MYPPFAPANVQLISPVAPAVACGVYAIASLDHPAVVVPTILVQPDGLVQVRATLSLTSGATRSTSRQPSTVVVIPGTVTVTGVRLAVVLIVGLIRLNQVSQCRLIDDPAQINVVSRQYQQAHFGQLGCGLIDHCTANT